MIFNEVIGLEGVPDSEDVIFRKAVRAVVFNEENRLVMVKSSNKDYRFPGGGLEDDELQLETLRREALEESGVVIKEDVQLIGIVEERRRSFEVEDAYFVMRSTYYLCQVKEYGDVQLEEYEKELGFTPAEIEIEDAYSRNLEILEGQPNRVNPCVERDTLVLKYLIDNKEELLKMGSV